MRGSRTAPCLAGRGSRRSPAALAEATADKIIAAIAGAARPVIIAGPQTVDRGGRALLAKLEAATGAPAVIMESPRGIADATLGAFPDLIKRADLIVLLGKALDFTTKWATGPAFDPNVRLIAIDPDAALVEPGQEGKGRAAHDRLRCRSARRCGYAACPRRQPRPAQSTGTPRPAQRSTTARRCGAASSRRRRAACTPAEVFRALRPFVERDPDTVLICDGGEFAQWGQSMLPVRRRLINGVTGSIGSSLSFALAARLVEPKAPVFAVLGDGTIGFHISEFETAVRRGLPFVADPRQRRALERGERNPAPRLRRQPHARLRALAGALRPGGGGARRPRRACRARRRLACRRSSARLASGKPACDQRHDREHRCPRPIALERRSIEPGARVATEGCATRSPDQTFALMSRACRRQCARSRAREIAIGLIAGGIGGITMLATVLYQAHTAQPQASSAT